MKSYTDLEQSKKLAEILPLESSDMHSEAIEIDGDMVFVVVFGLGDKNKSNYGSRIWSLAALLGVLKKYGLIDLRFLSSTFDSRGEHLINVWCCMFDNITVSFDCYADNPVDVCYEMIIKLHEQNLL